MGTTLKVQPFNSFVYQLSDEYTNEDEELSDRCCRVLINKEKTGINYGFKFNDISSNDIFLEGYTDDIVNKLIDDLGWRVNINKIG